MKPHIEIIHLLGLTLLLLGSLKCCNGNPFVNGVGDNYVNIDDRISGNETSDTTEEPSEDSTVPCWGPACSLYPGAEMPNTQQFTYTFSGWRYRSASEFPPQDTTVACTTLSPTGCPPPKYVIKHWCGNCKPEPVMIISPNCPCNDCWNACNTPFQDYTSCPCNDCLYGCDPPSQKYQTPCPCEDCWNGCEIRSYICPCGDCLKGCEDKKSCNWWNGCNIQHLP